jgi:hypothetical protein
MRETERSELVVGAIIALLAVSAYIGAHIAWAHYL